MRSTTLLRHAGCGRSNVYRVAALQTRLCSQQTVASKPISTPIVSTPVAEPATSASDEKPESRFITDLGIKSLVPEWRRMFDRSTIANDVTAGITVGCVAVPLSLAIALASGVPPEVGLASAAVAGIVGGLMGGTTLAITGPAAAISLLVCEAVQTHGLGTLPFITLACGGLQLATGIVRGGGMAKYVPDSVIAGFTTGIGVMILAGQLPKALDMTVPAGLNTVEVLSAVASGLNSASPTACALALGVIATMQLAPKIHPKMPSALVAVGGATAVTQFGGVSAKTIGALPSGLSAFALCMPVVPPLEALPSLASTVMIIYALTSAETLLSCTALDKLRPTSYKHNPDQELVGQGMANMTAAAFAGMPVTAVIARSSLNVKLQANSRLPSIVQSAFVFGSLAFYSDVISAVPISALAGVLISSGAAMLKPHELETCLAEDKYNMAPYLVTTGGMLTMGMAEGILLGCATSAAKYGARVALLRYRLGGEAAEEKVEAAAPAAPAEEDTKRPELGPADTLIEDAKERPDAQQPNVAILR